MASHIEKLIRKYFLEYCDKVHFQIGSDRANHYSWVDYEAREHIRCDHCFWSVPFDAKIEEVSYEQFVDTYVGARSEVGLNVSGAACGCGKYENITLRVVDTFGNAIKALVRLDSE